MSPPTRNAPSIQVRVPGASTFGPGVPARPPQISPFTGAPLNGAPPPVEVPPGFTIRHEGINAARDALQTTVRSIGRANTAARLDALAARRPSVGMLGRSAAETYRRFRAFAAYILAVELLDDALDRRVRAIQIDVLLTQNAAELWDFAASTEGCTRDDPRGVAADALEAVIVSERLARAALGSRARTPSIGPAQGPTLDAEAGRRRDLRREWLRQQGEVPRAEYLVRPDVGALLAYLRTVPRPA